MIYGVKDLDIRLIRELIKQNRIFWSGHIIKRMAIRGIKIKDVIECVNNGEFIEEYKEDFPYPSCLILGFVNDKGLHVVWGIGEKQVWMITAYYPSLEEWENDLKTRRRVEWIVSCVKDT